MTASLFRPTADGYDISAAGVLVQAVPCAVQSLRRYVQHAHGLARFDAVPAFDHGGGNGALAGREHAAAPTADGTRTPGAACALLAPAIAQHVNHDTHVHVVVHAPSTSSHGHRRACPHHTPPRPRPAAGPVVRAVGRLHPRSASPATSAHADRCMGEGRTCPNWCAGQGAMIRP